MVFLLAPCRPYRRFCLSNFLSIFSFVDLLLYRSPPLSISSFLCRSSPLSTSASTSRRLLFYFLPQRKIFVLWRYKVLNKLHQKVMRLFYLSLGSVSFFPQTLFISFLVLELKCVESLVVVEKTSLFTSRLVSCSLVRYM